MRDLLILKTEAADKLKTYKLRSLLPKASSSSSRPPKSGENGDGDEDSRPSLACCCCCCCCSSSGLGAGGAAGGAGAARGGRRWFGVLHSVSELSCIAMLIYNVQRKATVPRAHHSTIVVSLKAYQLRHGAWAICPLLASLNSRHARHLGGGGGAAAAVACCCCCCCCCWCRKIVEDCGSWVNFKVE